MPDMTFNLADFMVAHERANPEWHRQVAEAYQAGFAAATTSNSAAWWVSQEGFHFVPDTNAQTTAARGTGPRRHILNETFPLNHPTPVACLDIEPEDL